MVQIGNFHIGEAQTAIPPMVNSGEAFLLWDYLTSRYDNIRLTQLLQNYAQDPEFGLMLKSGLSMLEKQINEVEKEMNKLQLTLPNRPPKSISTDVGSEIWTDELMFKQVFTDIQSFLDQHTRTIRSITTNDPLRQMFIKFLTQELDVFDTLCKYGKLKGWISNPPMFKIH